MSCLQKKRRSIDRPVALAAPLLPFVKQNNGAGMRCTVSYPSFADMTCMSRVWVWVWMWVGVPSLLSERILPRLDVPANDIRRILSHFMLSGIWFCVTMTWHWLCPSYCSRHRSHNIPHSLNLFSTHTHNRIWHYYLSDPLDIDDGLYNFLSPQLIIRTDDGVTAGPCVGDGATQDSMGVELPRPPSMLSMPDKPEWFQKGTVYGIRLLWYTEQHRIVQCHV